MTMMAILELFAKILDYPDLRPDCAVEECLAALGPENNHVAALLRHFQASQSFMGIGQLQELYTGTFDMVPDCSLNLGYQLFGDDWRRSTFLADLAGRYRAYGVPAGKELPDHLCLILRYLAKRGDENERAQLSGECLVPALVRLLKEIRKRDNPYEAALEALLMWLERLTRERAVAAKTVAQGDR